MSPDNHYVNSKLAEIYDFDSPWSIDRDFYLSLAGTTPKDILDLGCGTGLLSDAYAANGHTVTAVDPSKEMLDVGRRKPHAYKIEWVQSFAQTYDQPGKLFDLIVMTGHAFQVLLEDADVLAAFSAMRRHLKADGLIIFESRNPVINWAEEWDYDLVLETPGGVVHESRRFEKMEGERMVFRLGYKFPDETLSSTSELRFLSRNGIEDLLSQSGLCIDKLMGDWDGSAFDEKSSKEMIFLVRAL